jgi:alkylation response protein AidB-like acyl-CoA dehydrogenase
VKARVVERVLPNPESRELLEMVSAFADATLAPLASQAEAAGDFPRSRLRQMGELGLLSLPFPEEQGGGGQSYEVYLQVLEEVAARWVTVALAMSVHALSCHPLSAFGASPTQSTWLEQALSGAELGAYCLSESHAGSDPGAMRTTANHESGVWHLNGTKAWVTHGGLADFYTVFARTSLDSKRGISCFHVPAGAPHLSAGTPEVKMGLTGSPTTMMFLDDVQVDGVHLIGEAGDGMGIALSALDAGRLGIAAIAVGLSQAALDYAVEYALQRETFGKPIISHQAVGFLLADMDAHTQAAREMYLAAARRKDAGLPYAQQASIAKLIATDTAMKVTTDAVQVLGGAGYTRDHPVERYMREAKIMQIFEGTNQIQRLVISRHLANRGGGAAS